MDFDPRRNHQRTHRGLVHGWQQCAQGDHQEHHLVEPFERYLPAQPFQQRRGKLQRHDANIDRHTDRGFKQHRRGVEMAGDIEVRQVPVTADVDGDRQPAQRIAEQAG
ncbi:hypothetical protein D3C80_1566770 [compost metagenome]